MDTWSTLESFAKSCLHFLVVFFKKNPEVVNAKFQMISDLVSTNKWILFHQSVERTLQIQLCLFSLLKPLSWNVDIYIYIFATILIKVLLSDCSWFNDFPFL